MVCRLSGAKSSSDPMFVHQEKISSKLRHWRHFHTTEWIWKCCLKIGRPFLIVLEMLHVQNVLMENENIFLWLRWYTKSSSLGKWNLLYCNVNTIDCWWASGAQMQVLQLIFKCFRIKWLFNHTQLSLKKQQLHARNSLVFVSHRTETSWIPSKCISMTLFHARKLMSMLSMLNGIYQKADFRLEGRFRQAVHLQKLRV